VKGKMVDIKDRKKVEGEKRLLYQAQVLESLSEAVIATDAALIITGWNKAAEKILGWTAKETVGKSALDIIRSVYVAPNMDEQVRRWQEKGSWEGEVDIRRKDGSRAITYCSSNFLKDVNGKVTGSVSVVSDISERKALEEELKLRTLMLDNTADAVFVWDMDNKMTYVNETASLYTGYTREELLLVPFLSLTTFSCAAEIKRQVESMHRKGRAAFECAILKKDGAVLAAEANSSVIEIGDRKLIVAVLRDIEVRKKAEEEREHLLRQVTREKLQVNRLAKRIAEEKGVLDVIMENTHAQLVYLDPEFNIVHVNEAYAHGSGHKKEELIGKNHFDLFPDKENLAIFEWVRDREQPVEYHDKPFTFADQPERGTTYWDWVLAPVKDSSEKLQGLVLSLIETTERKKLDQLKDEFIGMVSHEMRTPLTVVMGVLNTLLSDWEKISQEDTRQLMLDAASESEELSHILENLLELSRAKANKLTLNPEEVDIKVVLLEVMNGVKKLTTIHRMSLSLSPDLPLISVDPLRLKRILYNLLENAVKYSPNGGDIKISARVRGEEMVVSIKDQGKGMSPEEQERIFNPFERLAPMSEAKGIGLGLMVCQRLVEAHQGRIWVESEQGKGSTFYFTLPLNRVEEASGHRK